MDSGVKTSKEREAFYNCSQSCGKGLSQSENPPFPWTFPALTTMPTEIISSPTDSSIHADPQARELADVLKRILQSPTHDCTPPSDKFSVLPESADLSSLLCCYEGYFSPLASSEKQLEEYVHELVPALQLIGSTDVVDKGQRQEAMKLSPDAVLTRNATGMGWSRSQTPAATASNSQTKEVGGILDIVDIGSVVSEQSLHRYSSSKVSVPHASDGIGDLLSDNSGTFSAFESLEVDSSCPERVEVDKANAFSDGSMVDTGSELIDEDCFLENTENVLPTRLALYGDEVFSQNCAAAGVIRDEPTSVFSSDSVLTAESKALKDLHPGPNEIWELQKRARGMESQIQAGVVSQGVGPLQGTVLGSPCQSGLLQAPVNQNIAMLQGFRAMPQAAEPPVDSSSPLATSTNLLSVAPAQGLLNAAALLGGPGAATPSHRDNMRELAYRVAAFQPINWSKIEGITRPKRRNVRISKDPQSIAARRRRERISDRIRILQRLVPGGTRMDTASMLDETINYVKFLKVQVQALQRLENSFNGMYSSHHVFNRNCNNHLGRNDFSLDLAAKMPVSQPLINPHQLHFPTSSQHDFQSFFNPDQHLHQQPCH